MREHSSAIVWHEVVPFIRMQTREIVDSILALNSIDLPQLVIIELVPCFRKKQELLELTSNALLW